MEDTLLQIVRDLAKRNPDVEKLKFIRDDANGIKISILGTGSSNYVVKVTSQNGAESVIVKHSPPSMKSFAGIPATQERVHVDYHALLRYQKVCPGSVPTPYCLDETLHAFAMEDLSGMTNLSTVLNAGTVDVTMATRIFTLMARVHNATWKDKVSAEEWKELEHQFNKPSLTRFKADAEFVWCLDENDAINKIEDENLAQFRAWRDAGELKVWMNTLGDRTCDVHQCLVHNDLYTSSVMVNGPNMKVYDMEFTSLGVAGIDPGMFLSCYILVYYRFLDLGRTDVASQCLKAIKESLEAYLNVMGPTLEESGLLEETVADITGYTAWGAFRLPIFADVHFHFDLTPGVKLACMGWAMRTFPQYRRIRTLVDFMALFPASDCT